MRQPSFFRLYDQIAFLVFPVEESDCFFAVLPEKESEKQRRYDEQQQQL